MVKMKIELIRNKQTLKILLEETLAIPLQGNFFLSL